MINCEEKFNNSMLFLSQARFLRHISLVEIPGSDFLYLFVYLLQWVSHGIMPKYN